MPHQLSDNNKGNKKLKNSITKRIKTGKTIIIFLSLLKGTFITLLEDSLAVTLAVTGSCGGRGWRLWDPFPETPSKAMIYYRMTCKGYNAICRNCKCITSLIQTASCINKFGA